MRPLSPAEIQPDLLATKPILLLDTTKFATRFVTRQLLADKLPARIPIEIWLNILELCIDSSPPKYETVRPISMSTSPNGQVLRCRAVDIDLGVFDSKTTVLAAEKFLQSQHAYNQSAVEDDPDFTARDTDTMYTIYYPRNPTASRAGSPKITTFAYRTPECLFTAITVPDVIAWLENGCCWVCRGDRDICPGCTGGVAQKFDAFMGCGVMLACPLCMGLDFMQEDKEFLHQYYWEDPPLEEEATRQARLVARWRELGYEKKKTA
ncbi:MAG: hypothetical protein Q9209_005502 [Squamulea sp. 1 TL-2023]